MLNKVNCTLVKSYQVISYLNQFGTVLEKLVVEYLSQFCKINQNLLKKEMRSRKPQSVINTSVTMIHKVNQYGKN